MNIRPATVDDAAGIARVHIQSWRETYSALVEPGELDHLSLERRTDRWRQIIGDGGQVWVALSGDEVVGFAGLGGGDHEDPPRPIELGSLYVLAEQHGSGAGQGLLDAAIGDSPAYLFVAAHNPRATRFYERNGFALDGVTEQHTLAITPILALRMVR